MLKELFDNYDRDGSGEIDTSELRDLVRDLGWEPNDYQEREQLFKRLEEARSNADNVGAWGEDGNESISFSEFLQLMRMVHNMKEQVEEERLEQIAAENKFTEGEVRQFREVFFRAAQHDSERLVFETGGGEPEKPACDHLSVKGFKHLLRLLGVTTLKTDERKRLDDMLKILVTDDDPLNLWPHRGGPNWWPNLL